jgi:hypothetical protein
MEYKGGTYISQIEALSKEAACVEWAKKLEVSKIYSFGQSSKEKLIAEMKDEEPVALNGLTNVWNVSTLIRGELALINFIQTNKAADNEPTAANN